MANGQMIVDEGSTVALIQAFATAYSDQAQAQSEVMSTHGSLAGGWKGRASDTFGGGLEEWKDGLAKIQQGLEGIRASMVEFSKLTATLEDDNILEGQLTMPSAGSAITPATPSVPASWT